jgi:CHAT domain-containing protein/Tfp pilus assembly protein PilF
MSGREHPMAFRGLVLAVCCVALSGGTTALQQGGAPTRASVRTLIDAGRYEDAETAADHLVARITGENLAGSLESVRATDLLVEALVRNGKGAQARTREIAEGVVRLRESQFGADALELSVSLRNLAQTLMAAGESRLSEPLLERALSIHEREEGPQAIATADALEDLASAQIQNDHYDTALQPLGRALRIKETSLLPSDRGVARTLEQFARVQQGKGDYSESRRLLERALGIREAVQPSDPELGNTLNLLGDQLFFEGDFQNARRVYARALAAQESRLRSDHPLLSITLRNLAAVAISLGDITGGRSLLERAMSIAEGNLGPAHPEITDYLNDLAIANNREGNSAAARALYERAIDILENRASADPQRLATLVYNLALVDAGLGDFTQARRQFDRATAIWQRVLGRDHPFVARAVAALAGVLRDQRRYAEARPLFERALTIRERSLGPDHRDVARTLVDLATILARQGQLSRAQELSARAVGIWERSKTPDSPAFAVILALHADLQVTRGDFDAARHYYARALEIRTRVVGASHPDYADTEARLAVALAGLGESASAVASALHAEETGRQHLRLTLRNLPERQSLAYAATRPKGLDLALSLANGDTAVESRVFDALIKSRALVLDEMAARRHVSTDLSRPDIAPLWAALTSARQRLANLVVRGPSDQRPQQFLTLVDEARREKELAERALADKSATFRDELAHSDIGLDEVRAALPVRSALVAFARYDRTIIGGAPTQTSRSASPAPRPARRTVPSYVAFVIRSGDPDISITQLGSASVVDSLVARWRDESTGILRAISAREAEQAYRTAGAALRRRVWDPIASRVKDAGTVFVVPDGTLNLVSLAALPIGQAKYLVDEGPIVHYLSAERDLVTNTAASSTNRGLLAIGGAAFDDATLFTGATLASARKAVTSQATPAALARVRGNCGDLQTIRFDALAGTTKEAREVARLWTESPTQVLERRDASERAFKDTAPGHRVLHLATHGFFLGSTCSPAASGTRSVGGLSKAQTTKSTVAANENLLVLSGLALAGANRRAAAGPNDEDGILTAEEVAGLNLEGVEWTVLSACDTGLGEVRVGEGVFGLRRAFQVAGVRTVIMSLWPVEDQSALDWMRALYSGRLQKHLATAEAMRDASLTVLRARRAHSQSTHPFYWGGFVAAGDWR